MLGDVRYNDHSLYSSSSLTEPTHPPARSSLATLPAAAAPSQQCRLSCTYNCSRVKLCRAPPLRATAHNKHRQAAKMPTTHQCSVRLVVHAKRLITIATKHSCLSFQAENHFSIQTFGLNHDFVLSFYRFFISVFRFLASRFLVLSSY